MSHVPPKSKSEPRKPGFLWQGLLILLPVIVLSVAGLASLRQDKRLVEAQARQRAQEIADELADRIDTALGSTNELASGSFPRPLSFQIDQQGRLLSPPPVSGLPVPLTLDPRDLNGEQARLWQAARRGGSDAPERTAAITAWQQFIALQPPERFGAVAAYSLAILLADQGQGSAAAEALRPFSGRWLQATGETGLPLAPLAALKRLEIAAGGTNVTTASPEVREAARWLASNALAAPTLLTPFLLEKPRGMEERLGLGGYAAVWQKDWERAETARGLYAASQAYWRTNLSVNTAFPGDAAAASVISRLSGGHILLPRVFWVRASQTMEVGPPSTTRIGPARQAGGAPRTGETSWLDQLRQPPPSSPLSNQGDSPVQWMAVYDTAPVGMMSIQSESVWLAVRHLESDGSMRVLCWPTFHAGLDPSSSGTNLTLPVRMALDPEAKRLPEYFGFSLDLGGQPVYSSNAVEVINQVAGGKGGGQYWKKSHSTTAPPILATATRGEQEGEYLRVAIHLTGPEMLYEVQRVRQGLFGLLILASAGAVLVGFLAAWRAFLRQQRLSEMKSNFVSSVSHELRAPIASVRLMTESLERGKVPEPARQREYFRFILQECRRLSSLIENVLDFSRIEQGRKQYEFEPTDVGALAEATVKLMEPNATEKQVTLAFTKNAPATTRDLQPLLDARAIQQALVNLIDNAIKHSPAGETVTVELAAPDGTKEGDPFLVSVYDHGPGIPPEDHARIFERFYRRGSELRRETQGVGIGLSIVKHIVEAHRGRVRVESEAGKGSRFIMELPLSPNGEPQSKSGDP